jgi:hypothetical protein
VLLFNLAGAPRAWRCPTVKSNLLFFVKNIGINIDLGAGAI